jgi:hypothetical protein
VNETLNQGKISGHIWSHLWLATNASTAPAMQIVCTRMNKNHHWNLKIKPGRIREKICAKIAVGRVFSAA